jgi:hypothetical protein
VVCGNIFFLCDDGLLPREAHLDLFPRDVFDVGDAICFIHLLAPIIELRGVFHAFGEVLDPLSFLCFLNIK